MVNGQFSKMGTALQNFQIKDEGGVKASSFLLEELRMGINLKGVHSQYKDFSRNFISYPISNSAQTSLEDEIARLETIAYALKAEAQEFFGNGISTPRELWAELSQENLIFNQKAMQIIASYEMQALLINQQSFRLNSNDLMQNEFKNGIQSLVNKTANEPLDSFSLDQLANYYVKQVIKGLKPGSNKQYDISSNLQTLGTNNEFTAVEKRIFASVGQRAKKATTIKKKIKEAIAEELKQSSNFDQINISNKQRFLDRFEQRMQESLIGITYNEENHKSYMSEVKQRFSFLNLSSIVTKELASGAIGEELVGAFQVLQSDNGTEIISQVGSISSEDMRKLQTDLIEEERKLFTIRDPKKQSYADMIFVHNGKRVLVQSKTHISALQGFIEKGHGHDTIRLLEDEQFTTLAQKITSSSTSAINITEEDLSNMAYAIVNAIWFSKKGSYLPREEKQEIINLTDIIESIQSVFNNIIIDYFGIILGKNNEVLPKISNIFFLIDGHFLFPTYLIPQAMAQILIRAETARRQVKVYLRTTGDMPGTEPKDLFVAECESGSSPSQLGYQVGEQILPSVGISINFTADLEELSRSSYNLFESAIFK